MSAGTSSQSSAVDNPNISVVHVAIPNQSVIQTHPTLIQSAAPTVQTIHVTAIEDGLVHESKKRREILARRPSYRKILNELSSDGPAIPGVDKIEEESNSSQEEEETNLNAVQYQATSVPQAIQITAHPQGSAVGAGLQTLTMTNASNSSPGATPGATIVQYAQGPDGQFYIPVGGGGVQAYQLASATALTPSVMMAQPGSGMSSPIHGTEEVSRKRELRLLKNREAARECRRKKKEYVKCLENRVAVLENQNKTLIEELKTLKELYCQKEG